MEADFLPNLWQDAGCSCRKTRAPKIGDIPRHQALDVDVKSTQNDSILQSANNILKNAVSYAPLATLQTYAPLAVQTHPEPPRTSSNTHDISRLLVDDARTHNFFIRTLSGEPDAVKKAEQSAKFVEVQSGNPDKDTKVGVVGPKQPEVQPKVSEVDKSRLEEVKNSYESKIAEANRNDPKLANRPELLRRNHSAVIDNIVPFPTPSLDASNATTTTERLSPRLFVQSKSLAGPEYTPPTRPIFPNLTYSPYCSPTNSPRCKKKQPLRESRRVSIEKTDSYLQLNQYKLLDSIGQGSYGVVKLAYNQEEDSHYAMKILSKKKLFRKSGIFGRLPPKKEGRSSSAPINHPLEKVYREIAILKKLDHPNIVKLVEVLDDPDEDHLYLAFELLDRGQVLELPTDQPLPEDKSWSYFRDVVLGIEYLHFQRIIHRDIKPANLLLNDQDRVQITDFGVCNEFHGEDIYVSSTVGTPAFTPPEALGEERYAGFSGKCTDIWSMGITLYSFVYGHVPFHDENIIGLYTKIRHQNVEFPEKPTISNDLMNLIKRMLVKDPSQRITLPEIKVHPWITKHGLHPLPTEEENCHLVEVTEEDVRKVITSIPKLDTLILIKHMLKKHSFQNPFLHRRDTTLGSETRNSKVAASKRHIGRSGRSNSAPDSYSWSHNRQVSIDSSLESVLEVTTDQHVEETNVNKHNARVGRALEKNSDKYSKKSQNSKPDEVQQSKNLQKTDIAVTKTTETV